MLNLQTHPSSPDSSSSTASTIMTFKAKKYLGGSGARLNFFITVATCTVLAFYGYDQGVFGGVIIGDPFLEQFDNPDDNVTATMTSVYNLGCFGGAVATAFFGDKVGRPRTLILGTSFILVGAIIQSSAYGRAQMFVGRVVAGCGTGINTSTAGIYQSETAKFASRGKLVVLQMAMCIFGFMLSNWLTFGFSFVNSGAAWRFPLAFQIVFCSIIYSICPFLPESPRLLVRKGRHEEALDVLSKLAGDNLIPEDPVVQTQYRSIQEAYELESSFNVTLWDILCGRGRVGALRRLILGAGMQAMNQLSGINITSYYFSYVLIHAVKVETQLARILSCAGSVNYLIFSLISYWTIERFGRRRMMMFSSAGVSMCFMVITISLSFMYKGHDDHALGICAVFFFFLFFSLFAIGCLGVPWLYPTEINTLEVRTKGAAIAAATNWIVNYMVVQVTPPGVASLGWKFWIVWTTISASFVVWTFFFYPETANRTLEDIDLFFDTEPSYFIHNNKLATQLTRPQEFIENEKKTRAEAEAQFAIATADEKEHLKLVEDVQISSESV
ncbi:general substrate transporter [Limtongia smithiae]|uniref:general substrate transporter n=1 Tax=Limtongia smithiae TaxID=1125753 RepID=UPI0034CDC476